MDRCGLCRRRPRAFRSCSPGSGRGRIRGRGCRSRGSRAGRARRTTADRGRWPSAPGPRRGTTRAAPARRRAGSCAPARGGGSGRAATARRRTWLPRPRWILAARPRGPLKARTGPQTGAPPAPRKHCSSRPVPLYRRPEGCLPMSGSLWRCPVGRSEASGFGTRGAAVVSKRDPPRWCLKLDHSPASPRERWRHHPAFHSCGDCYVPTFKRPARLLAGRADVRPLKAASPGTLSAMLLHNLKIRVKAAKCPEDQLKRYGSTRSGSG
jgi:hypothetical protein